MTRKSVRLNVGDLMRKTIEGMRSSLNATEREARLQQTIEDHGLDWAHYRPEAQRLLIAARTPDKVRRRDWLPSGFRGQSTFAAYAG